MLLNSLSIIIPTKDRGNVFNKTLRAAYEATNNIMSEILIINDSKTNSIHIEEKYTDRVMVLDNPKRGVASARNYGAKNAIYNHLLFLDDDIIITENNITELLINAEQYPNTAINFNWIYPSELIDKISNSQFGRYLIKNGFTSLKGWSNNLKWNDEKLFEPDLIASYFLFINKQNFNMVGGYNEKFPHAGAEDFEFAKRLKKSNIKGICNPLVKVLHNEADRVDLIPWLQRKERAAETRKIAVNIGNEEMIIRTTQIKKKLILFIYFNKPVLFFVLKCLPNNRKIDFIYFKIVNRLLSAYLFKGYFKN